MFAISIPSKKQYDVFGGFFKSISTISTLCAFAFDVAVAAARPPLEKGRVSFIINAGAVFVRHGSDFMRCFYGKGV